MKQQIPSTAMRIVIGISRLFAGAVFLFSGFVKGVDPMGFTYKIEEYLNVFGFEWAIPLAFAASVVMCAIEFTIGVALIFNAHKNLTAWLLLLFMSFFTILTFTDALTNKVDDCGCFGDAVKLTNWQTFWKNVVLMVPTIILFVYRNRKVKKKTFEQDTLVVGLGITAMVIFCLYNYYNEPVLDFRPWKVGNRMMNEERGEVVNYVTYENIETGELDEFPSSELMKKYTEDSTWAETHKWVNTRTYDPNEIYADGFSMLGTDGMDHAKEIVGQEDYVLIATIHDLDMTKKGLRNLKNIYREAAETHVHFVILTCALDNELGEFLIENGMEDAEYYYADDKAIKTVLRSNPGLILLKNAEVMGKWHYRNFPELADLNLNSDK
ncbi:DoxX family protein [Bacteroidales bacterium OttesenSCG-928-C19]|nr:DoxX family protein [Bacteroidales bacterium OttesenSCG-928-C19]